MAADQIVPTAEHSDDLADRVAALTLFESVPAGEIAWFLERAVVRTYGQGDTLRGGGSAVEEMSILMSGRLALHMPRNGGWRKILEVGPGYVLGVIPYSRMRSAPGKIIVETDAALLALHQKHFQDLVRDCPGITTALVHQMLDRAREFRTLQLHDERLLALGKLASGLAHELNNPASGASSSARALEALLDQAETAARALAGANLNDAQLEAIDAVRTLCCRPASERGTLELADREDDLTDWLDRRGIDSTTGVALASSDLDLAALDALAEVLSADALRIAIDWLASGLAARELARQIQSATARVHDLVAAIKGFTFMDRESVLEELDIARGLGDTVAMLESKARARSVGLRTETAQDLSHVFGYGGEVNQVWEKLIDNAIDAAPTPGNVTITATMRGDSILVRVADDGPGIPQDVRARIFDPFFTTKPVGKGTGLGLYNARRIVHLHHGDIDFTTQPGRTVFRVRLPVTGAMPTPTDQE